MKFIIPKWYWIQLDICSNTVLPKIIPSKPPRCGQIGHLQAENRQEMKMQLRNYEKAESFLYQWSATKLLLNVRLSCHHTPQHFTSFHIMQHFTTFRPPRGPPSALQLSTLPPSAHELPFLRGQPGESRSRPPAPCPCWRGKTWQNVVWTLFVPNFLRHFSCHCATQCIAIVFDLHSFKFSKSVAERQKQCLEKPLPSTAKVTVTRHTISTRVTTINGSSTSLSRIIAS